MIYKITKFVIIILSFLFLFLLVSIFYFIVEQATNGLEKGKIVSVVFDPAHTESHTRSVNSGKSIVLYKTSDDIPDSYIVNVIGKNNRKEVWRISDPNYIPQIGDSVQISKYCKVIKSCY